MRTKSPPGGDFDFLEDGKHHGSGIFIDVFSRLRTNFVNSPCAPAHSSAINNSPRADVWLAGVFLQLSGLVRHQI